MKQLLGSKTVGWFLLTITGLVMFSQYLAGIPFSIYVSAIFLIGLIIVMNQSPFLALSDSSIKVRQEIRSRSAHRAHQVHKRHTIHPVNYPYSLMHVLGLLAVILSLAIPVRYWLLGIFIVVLVAWQYYAWRRRNQEDLFWGQLFFFLVVFVWAVQGTGTTIASFNDLPSQPLFRSLLAVATFIFTLGSTIPLIMERRDEVRSWVRNQFIVLTGGFLTVIYFLLYPQTDASWLNGVLMLGSWYFILAAFSWLSHQEYSYAKYFALVGSGLMFLSTFYISEPIYTAILFFGLSVGVTTAGFVYPSYTARTVGLITNLLFVAMYFLSISPMQWMYGYEAATAGLGLVSALYLLTLARWYDGLPKNSQEQPYTQAIRYICVISALLILISVLMNSSLTRLQAIPLGIIMGLATTYLGKVWSLPWIRILGIAVSVVYILSILLVI